MVGFDSIATNLQVYTALVPPPNVTADPAAKIAVFKKFREAREEFCVSNG